jgi:MORN repeat variant
MRWLLIAFGLALAALAAGLAAQGTGDGPAVLEQDADGSTVVVGDGTLEPHRRVSRSSRAELDAVGREGLLDEDDLLDPDGGAEDEDVLPPGYSIEMPYLKSKNVDPEITSPLPDDYELLAFDGPLVRAEYEDGTLWFEAQRSRNAEGEWERDGLWNCWHSNGELHEQGEYRGAVEHGAWSWWYPDGNRMAAGRFVNGERSGDWDWFFDTGELAMEGRYERGAGVGTWTLYYPNGARHAAGSFIDGEASGHWTVWTQSGAVDPNRTSEYMDGVMVE